MEFNCREIVYSVVSYSKADFSGLDLVQEVKNWQEELQSNSTARPVLLGSPFDDEDGNMGLDIETEDELDAETVYAVLYYFYEDAIYSVSDEVCEGWSVNCDSILAELDIACAMESVTDGDEAEYFECISSSDRSETMLALFQGSEEIIHGEIDELFSSL